MRLAIKALAYLHGTLRDQSQDQRVSWTSKNVAVGRPFLDHTLAVADLAVALQVSARGRDDVELIARSSEPVAEHSPNQPARSTNLTACKCP